MWWATLLLVIGQKNSLLETQTRKYWAVETMLKVDGTNVQIALFYCGEGCIYHWKEEWWNLKTSCGIDICPMPKQPFLWTT